ncbi:hypothetical protein [Novosphingobium sp.]|uniref:hypothetical protein n=1 Tax=Novosphingobium sp. TaxID=1874826 RepID=UPI0025EC228C|nr:hypothetical protein [Novosphingobium sp.]
MRRSMEFGFTNPLLLNEHDKLLASVLDLVAGKRLDMPEAPTIQLKDMIEAQMRVAMPIVVYGRRRVGIGCRIVRGGDYWTDRLKES